MSKRRSRVKLAPFVPLCRKMLKSQEWRSLTRPEKITYIYLKHKFVGKNNGDIVLHYSEMKDMMSSSTIAKAFKGLEKKGWVTKTKVGGLYRYSNHYKLTGAYDEIILKYKF